MFKVISSRATARRSLSTPSPSDSLLGAAAKASIFLPAVCREGGCGTCRVTRKKGLVSLGPYSKTALTDADRATGDILLCRASACSDLELTAPFDHAAVGFANFRAQRADRGTCARRRPRRPKSPSNMTKTLPMDAQRSSFPDSSSN